jgi:hypothetical protein
MEASIESLATSEAVRLLSQRAAAIVPGFVVDEGLCRSHGQKIVEIGSKTGAFGRLMLRVPGLRNDWVELR